MKKFIEKIMSGQNLTSDEMVEVMHALMSGEVEPAVAGAFLTALKMKGESVSEIIGGARVLREKATPIDIQNNVTLDTCGTGGDVSGTYNISTAVAIVAAAGGVSVVKHGNRSVSSKCGCADVLEELGVAIDLPAPKVKQCVDDIGIGFLFAPTFHEAMRHVGPVRKALGYRTIFNILGPLANPANAKYQLVGVFDESLLDVYANVLKELGVHRAMVVHGSDGLDEITITGETQIAELYEGEITRKVIKPEDYGLGRASIEEVKGGERQLNATILRELFSGDTSHTTAAMRDILILNAGAAFYTCGETVSIQKGVDLAKELIENGKAKEKLEQFIEFSQRLKG